MRLFVAVDFDGFREYFEKLQWTLPPNAKFSFVKSFHLTLKFLGEVKSIDVDKIKEALASVSFDQFSVFLDSIGVFPSENHIRVVWVGIHPEEEIIVLQRSIDDALKDYFNREKNFKSHITLARVKEPQDKEGFVQHIRNIKVAPIKADISSFKLVRSTLTHMGPVYEDIAVFASKSS